MRIIRTARRLGIRTIAVFSDADADALHVRLADEAHRLGPAPARDSYLAIDRVIAAARASGAAAVHPGYGFLAENAAFAEACAAAGVVFVGPPPGAIRAMGLKDEAKALMQQAGVPVVPGYHGPEQDPAALLAHAEAIGWPVLVKAVAGGGGKGMRRVDRAADFAEALAGARREAAAAFGDDRVLIERYIAAPRHIEMQVLADSYGRTLHLFERDCSLQRRHQKVVEEAPAPGMTEAVRAAMGRAAVEAARAVGYVGAGTVEFIADGRAGLRPDGFWFMEMNTRLQVEHPVTEAITGLDLVELQLRIAAGEPLPLAQADLSIRGHAVEARLYAEDPDRGFLPSPGRLLAFSPPAEDGVRVDAGVQSGDVVSPFYDPMIAKVIAHASDRAAAFARLAAALDATLVAGPRTNLALLIALCRDAAVLSGSVETGLIERELGALIAVPEGLLRRAAAAAVRRELDASRATATPGGWPSPWEATDAFQLGEPRIQTVPLVVDGRELTAMVRWSSDPPEILVEGQAEAPAETPVPVLATAAGLLVLLAGRQIPVRFGRLPRSVGVSARAEVHAPLSGRVAAVLVETGAAVAEGQRVLLLEAMKMEHALTAPRGGVLGELRALAGTQVSEGDLLFRIDPG